MLVDSNAVRVPLTISRAGRTDELSLQLAAANAWKLQWTLYMLGLV